MDNYDLPYMSEKSKNKYEIYNYDGEFIQSARNSFPAGAARKAVNKGFTKILVYNPKKDKWYAYIGKRVKIPPGKRSQHQLAYNIAYTPKVFSHPVEEIADPGFLHHILGALGLEQLPPKGYEAEQFEEIPHGWQAEEAGRIPHGWQASEEEYENY